MKIRCSVSENASGLKHERMLRFIKEVVLGIGRVLLSPSVPCQTAINVMLLILEKSFPDTLTNPFGVSQ